MADLVIFACEGVLVDAERIVAEVRAEALTAAGLPVSAEELVEDFGGLSFKDILLRLEDKAHVPIQAYLLTDTQVRIDRRLKREAQAMAGAREALGRSARRCVVSNESLERTDALLEKAGLKAFVPKAVFCSASLDLKGRPSPDLLLHAAAKMDADPDECFVVESTAPGIEAARAAGMRAIGFSGGAQAWPGLADRLTEAGAETVMRRLSELRGVLAALSEWSAAD